MEPLQDPDLNSTAESLQQQHQPAPSQPRQFTPVEDQPIESDPHAGLMRRSGEYDAHQAAEGETGAEIPMGISAVISLGLAAVIMAGAFLLPESYIRDLLLGRGFIPPFLVFLACWSATVITWKRWKVARQLRAFSSDIFPTDIPGPITRHNIDTFRRHVQRRLLNDSDSILLSRVWQALEHFRSQGSRAEVATFLNTKSNLDNSAAAGSYTMLKVFIWAIPILGFVGTVIGISTAVGGFSDVLQVADDLGQIKTTLTRVTVGLAVAFDTTLLALVISVLIMFPASIVQRREERMLARVDDFCNRNVLHRLAESEANPQDMTQSIHNAMRAALMSSAESFGRTAAGVFAAEADPVLRQSFQDGALQIARAHEPASRKIEQLSAAMADVAEHLASNAPQLEQTNAALHSITQAIGDAMTQMQETAQRLVAGQQTVIEQHQQILHQAGEAFNQAALDRLEDSKALAQDQKQALEETCRQLNQAAHHVVDGQRELVDQQKQSITQITGDLQEYHQLLADNRDVMQTVISLQTKIIASLRDHVQSNRMRSDISSMRDQLSNMLSSYYGDGRAMVNISADGDDGREQE